jgi:hypothetical protein
VGVEGQPTQARHHGRVTISEVEWTRFPE